MTTGWATDSLGTLALAAYFLASPPAVALIIVRVLRRRVALAGVAPRQASRSYGRWFVLPWLLYLINLLAGGAYLGTTDLLAGPEGGRWQGVVVLGLVFVCLLPLLFLARVMRSWERSLGHPGGGVTLGVEARAWITYAGFMAILLGSFAGGMGVAGPVADRIGTLLSKAGAPISGVFVIPESLGASANAFVSGVLDGRRYLFLTEALLRDFSADEVNAVLAHEVGHLRHRHVARLGAALVGTAVVVASALMGLVGVALQGAPDRVRTPVFGVVGFLTVLSALFVTRRLARRYEYQADDFAAKTVGSGEPMVRALRKLARDNWLVEDDVEAGAFASHPSIQRRIQRLT